MKQAFVLSCLVLPVIWSSTVARCDERAAATVDQVHYTKHIKPLLAEKCYSCHGAIRQEAGLRLETLELLLTGGDSGPAIVSNAAEQSLILERVSSPDPDLRMPPEGEGAPLTAEQLQHLRRWIDAGAPAPHEEIPASPSQHWAFQPVVRPEIPKLPSTATTALSDSATSRTAENPTNALSTAVHPIDAFIAVGHATRQLKPVEPATSELLLRRVCLDLTGMPPTAEQRQQFLSETSENAYDALVEQLLASPHYGERWGRHWMDVWRYSDWYGLGAQLRNSQKHIWHWRDWIIESLNTDKGYDQMLREMLAADELYPTEHDRLRATGFLARHYYLFNRTTWLDDTIEHTSKAFLGLTLNCAKCHSHKYDPITHEDYYAMRAFFEPYQVRLDAVPGETDLEQNGLPRVFDAHLEAPTYIHVRGDEKSPDTSRPVAPHFPTILTTAPLTIEPVRLPAPAFNPAVRPFVLEDHLQNANTAIEKARDAVALAEKRLSELKSSAPAAPATIPENADFVVDEFDSLNEAFWQTGPGNWSVENGRLTQSQTGAARAFLRTRSAHPADFVATIRFTTTGGNKWRSVGLAFDVTGTQPGAAGEGVNEKMIYLSAVSPGSKLQVSYKSGGNQVYPPQAAKAMPVSLQTPYEMRIAIRGQLVNVAINGEHLIAYQLPVAREHGVMDLVAFDATAAFDAFTVRTLPTDEQLIPDSGSKDVPPLTVETAAEAVKVAKAQLEAAESYPDVLRTAFAADRAKAALMTEVSATDAETIRSDGSDAAAATASSGVEVDPFVAAAARAARVHELAQAKLQLAQASQKPDDQKALDAARKAVDAAQKAVEQPGDSYSSLPATLKALEGPDESEASRRQPYPQFSSGRRTALAMWMTDQQNPLTARVAVNHIWLRHFGQPLVETETDFGLRAARPVQHALLDWLAAELMENDWSMKHIHRLIVTSQTWQRSTSTLNCDPATLQTDPDNHFYWRRQPVRMESQVVRDSLLQLAGVLDPALGGPSLDAAAKASSFRRSLYFKHSRDDQNEFLAMFDDADILRCYRRSESVVPQQALALANSELALSMARKIAGRITSALQDEVTDERFIQHSFSLVLGRSPTDSEIAVCADAMSQTRGVLTDMSADQVTQRVRENLVHALINHNDFITVR